MNYGKKVALLGICLMLVCSMGCTFTNFTGLVPKSHFSYPNSNVTPLGRVVGESTRASLTPSFITAEQQEEAIKNALQQKPGSDILINYMAFQKMTIIPMLPIYITTYQVDGTAAKMEIGIQELK